MSINKENLPNLPKTERDRSGIFFPFSQVSVLQRVVF